MSTAAGMNCGMNYVEGIPMIFYHVAVYMLRLGTHCTKLVKVNYSRSGGITYVNVGLKGSWIYLVQFTLELTGKTKFKICQGVFTIKPLMPERCRNFRTHLTASSCVISSFMCRLLPMINEAGFSLNSVSLNITEKVVLSGEEFEIIGAIRSTGPHFSAIVPIGQELHNTND